MQNTVLDTKKMLEALDAKNLKAVRSLVDGGFLLDQSLRPDDNFTALHFAAGNGFGEACRLFIEAGADIDARCRTGVGALHFAANRKHPEICALLIDAGAYVHYQCHRGDTALHWAAIAGCAQSCEVLAKAGINLNAENQLGQTPLHHATSVSAFAYLLTAGADPLYAPKRTTNEYLTPFQAMTRACRIEQVRLCIERGGIDFEQKTLDGRSLEQLAGRRKAVKELLRAARIQLEDSGAAKENAPAAGSRKPSQPSS